MASMDIVLAVTWKDLEKASGDHQSCARTLNGPWLLFVSKSGLEKQDPFEQPSNILIKHDENERWAMLAPCQEKLKLET